MTESPVNLLPVIKWLGLQGGLSVAWNITHSWYSLCSTSVGANTVPPSGSVPVNDTARRALDSHTFTAELEQIVVLVAVCPCCFAFESDGCSGLDC